MSEDEYGYQEDFDENDQETFDPPPPREEDDEQHTQKINGKLEVLQQQVESLRQELEQERRDSADARKRYEREIVALRQSQTESKSADESVQSADEIQRYKKKCQVLEDKLEVALLTGNSSNKVPLALEEAFHKYCETQQVFPEHEGAFLTVNDCLNILKLSSEPNKRKKRSSMSAEVNSAPPSADSATLRSTNTVNRLSERVRNLEEELRIAEAASKDAETMKGKIFQASERIRLEKEQKRALEIELAATKKKVEMLGDHVEKLVVHIKREGAQKIRLAEQIRANEKESLRMKEKSDFIQKKSTAKDRLILELREGSKVLEDQLRLMDEKFLELRGKLDYARAIAARKIRKAEKTASDLRVKFAMTGSPMVLDAMPMPSAYGSSTYGAGEDGFDNEDNWGNEYEDSRAFLPPKKSGSVRMNSKVKNHNKGISLDSMSLNSGLTQKSEPTLDGVLDKIRYQTGKKPEWTEDKAKLLAKSR